MNTITLTKFDYFFTPIYGMAIANCIHDGQWLFVAGFSIVFALRTARLFKKQTSMLP